MNMKLALFIGSEHRRSDSMAQWLAEHSEQVRLARRVGFDGHPRRAVMHRKIDCLTDAEAIAYLSTS